MNKMPGVFVLSLFILFCNNVAAQDDERPSIYSLHIKTNIRFRFATTLVTSKLANPANVSREAVFDLDTPSTAFISNFSLEVEGKIYYGDVKGKSTARDQYTQSVNKGFSAGHISSKPNEYNKFTVAVVVAPLSKVVFNLVYQEVLERRLGMYKHEIYINPRQIVGDLKVEVDVQEIRNIKHISVPKLENSIAFTAKSKWFTIDRPSAKSAMVRFSPSIKQQKVIQQHESGVMGRFIVEYDVEQDFSGGEAFAVDGYFIHFFAPEITEEYPRDILFILDTSTSMADHKLGQLKDSMKVILEELSDHDRFNIMLFNNQQHFWSEKLQPVTKGTRAKALRYVQDLRTKQYTDILTALEKGISHLDDQKGEGIPMMFFLSDGDPTIYHREPYYILKHIKETNKNSIPIYSLAFGKGANWNIMFRLSHQNGGLYRRIYEGSMAALQISQFYKEVSTALLDDVQIHVVNDSVEWQSLSNEVPLYIQGTEVITVGKTDNNSTQNVQIHINASSSSGTVAFIVKSEETLKLSEDNVNMPNVTSVGNIIQRMWAFLTIKHYLTKTTSRDITDATKNAFFENLAIKYGFVTPLTSMVITTDMLDVWKVYDEDLNELHMRTIRPTIKPKPTHAPRRSWGGGGGGGGGWGGGGGDPHFMIGMKSLDYPICFDVVGNKNEVYTLFQDSEEELTVNVRFDSGKRDNRYGGKRVYIKEAVVIIDKHVVYVNHDVIESGNIKHKWEKSIAIRVQHAWLIVDAKLAILRLAFDSGLEVEVAQRTHTKHNILGDDFINVEIRHEEHASSTAIGLIGQFLKKNIELKLIKITEKDKLIAHLQLKDGTKVVQESRAALVIRPDPVQRKHNQCWMLRKNGLAAFVNPEKFLVKDMFDPLYRQ